MKKVGPRSASLESESEAVAVRQAQLKEWNDRVAAVALALVVSVAEVVVVDRV